MTKAASVNSAAKLGSFWASTVWHYQTMSFPCYAEMSAACNENLINGIF
jgi:hypothetical protein